MDVDKQTLKEKLFKTIQLGLALGLVLLAIYLWQNLANQDFQSNSLFGLGFLLLAGILGGQLAASFGLPRLTGFLFAGLLTGPSIFSVISDDQVKHLKLVNQLALALIAMQAGSEFTKEMLQKNIRMIGWGTLFHILFIGTIISGVLYAFKDHIQFFNDLPSLTVFWVSLLFGTLAMSKSPAAVVAVLGETKAKGPLSDYSLGMVVVLDVVVLVLFATVFMFAKSSLIPNSEISLNTLVALFQEIAVSFAAGTFFGMVLIAYLRLIDKEKILFLVLISFGVSALCDYLHYDTLLVFVIAGVTVTQFSNQSHKLVKSIEALSSVTMVVFFATAGASLHLSELAGIWPIVLGIFLTRTLATFLSEWATHSVHASPPKFKKVGFTPFVSQAGLTIGLATVIGDKLPVVGEAMATMAIALVTINEIVGPVLMKWGLKSAREIPSE